MRKSDRLRLVTLAEAISQGKYFKGPCLSSKCPGWTGRYDCDCLSLNPNGKSACAAKKWLKQYGPWEQEEI